MTLSEITPQNATKQNDTHESDIYQNDTDKNDTEENGILYINTLLSLHNHTEHCSKGPTTVSRTVKNSLADYW